MLGRKALHLGHGLVRGNAGERFAVVREHRGRPVAVEESIDSAAAQHGHAKIYQRARQPTGRLLG